MKVLEQAIDWPGRITILYGSQTGNAEDMAKRVGLQAKMLGHRVLVETMDDFQLKQLPKQSLVIFICSTTGHGQEPENMKNLFNFMRRKDLPRNCLARIKFAVYGLGDSSYVKFNYVSKILFKRLGECGAQPIQPLVAGDEQHQCGCDGVIYPKLDELWATVDSLQEETATSCDTRVTPQDILKLHDQPQVKFSYSVSSHTESSDNSQKTLDKFSDDFRTKYNLREAVCVRNERVTDATHFQDTRFLCFKSVNSDMPHYEAGDVCTIHPENSDENVQEFMRLLDLDPEQNIALKKLDSNYMINYLYDFVPDGLRVQDLVRYYLDIQSMPKRSFFEFLWPFSEDTLERDKLKEFASTEGQEEVYDYCIRSRRSILETMMDFPHTIKNIKFEALLDMIPPIKPRSFSIASASCARSNELHLIVGVVSYKTNMRKLRKGLCSNYLARMEQADATGTTNVADVLRFFIRRTAFKLPRDDQVPIIMVGPGLGIAPFRSFIEERHHRRRRMKCNSNLGATTANNYLYFGCRSPNKDFYFRDELESYASEGTIRLRVAFSRQEPKQYVQDLMLEDAELISGLIKNSGAYVYVAGNSRLPEELRVLLAKVLAREHGDSTAAEHGHPDEGEKMVAQLEANNRIQYDCW